MRSRLLDQYTYLHFAAGIIAYFWGLSFTTWLIAHGLYEFVEITPAGTDFINRYFGSIWPGGGKHKAEYFLNNGLGDTISSIIGWLSAYLLDKVGSNLGWYSMHIKK